jgi:hypothetical protein
MGEKWNMFYFPMMATVTIEAMNSEFQYDFSAAAKRFAAYLAEANRFNSYRC